MNIHLKHKTFILALSAYLAFYSCRKDNVYTKTETYFGVLHFHEYPENYSDSSFEKVTIHYLGSEIDSNKIIYVNTISNLGAPLNNDTLNYSSGNVDSTIFIWGGYNENQYFLTHYSHPDKIILNGCIGCSLGSRSEYKFTGVP